MPVTSVTALGAESRPPLGSALMVKVTPAFCTRLLAASRTTTCIVEVLLICVGEPLVTATVPGIAWAEIVLAVVATNVTLSEAAGGGVPVPVAVIVAGPAV